MERLKQLREARNYTQQWRCMQVGVSQATISGYEIGKAVPLLGRADIKESEPICQSDLLERFRALPEEKMERTIGLMMGLGE